MVSIRWTEPLISWRSDPCARICGGRGGRGAGRRRTGSRAVDHELRRKLISSVRTVTRNVKLPALVAALKKLQPTIDAGDEAA
jgi:hypothetical protein